MHTIGRRAILDARAETGESRIGPTYPSARNECVKEEKKYPSARAKKGRIWEEICGDPEWCRTVVDPLNVCREEAGAARGKDHRAEFPLGDPRLAEFVY